MRTSVFRPSVRAWQTEPVSLPPDASSPAARLRSPASDSPGDPPAHGAVYGAPSNAHGIPSAPSSHGFGGFSFPHAFGVADADSVIASRGDLDAVFPMASVTKAVAALSALVAVERRLISLEDPAGPPGSTVRHLLAHTSGLPFEGGAAISPPGQRRVYSNLGFEVLGERVEAATGVDIREWMEEAVLIPLGMSATAIPGSPAHSGEGSVRDLLALGRELLAPTLISADLHTEATSPQFPGISGILPGYGRQADNAWGLGVEIRDHKAPHWTGVSFSPRTFGHFGQAGSFLWVDPDAGRTGAFLGAKPFGAEHAEAWPALTDAMRAM